MAQVNLVIREISMRRVFMALVIFISGCATSDGYREELNQFIGAPEAKLVAAWGAPDSQYTTASGERILSYQKNRQFTKSSSQYVHDYKTGTGSYQPGGQKLHDMKCKTNFILVKSVVREVTFSGNDCTA